MLLHGRQNDLANATIRSCTVLHGDRWSTEWWSLERWQDRPVVVTGPDGGQIEVRQARLDPEGALVLVHPKRKLVRTSGRCGSDPHGLRPPREMRMVVARQSSTLLGAGEPVVQTDAGAFSVPRSVQCEDVYQRC